MGLNNSAMIETLRNVRGADDIISRLQASSLEARRDRIAEALKNENFEHGPAELVATYPKHVLALKEGVLMRIALEEDENFIKFGKIEVYDVPVPATSIGEEIIATAKASVDYIFSEDFEKFAPMITSIANALDIKGNLQKQIESDVRLRSLIRDAWWQDVVSENFKDEVKLPALRETDNTDAKAAWSGSVDDLLSIIRTEASTAVNALKKLSERKNILPVYIECANDICEDIKSAILALSEVNRESVEEMKTVYTTVEHVAPRLIQGSKFLVQLSNK